METNSMPWFKTRFGNFLTKFDSCTRNVVKYRIEEAFSEHDSEKENCGAANNNAATKSYKRIIGVYVVPSVDNNVKYLNDDVIDELKEFYVKINENCSREFEKYFEVVQVFYLSQKSLRTVRGDGDDDDDDVKAEFENQIATVPWFALPFDNLEKSIRIKNYYKVKDGEFALILLDAFSGELITRQGYDSLLEDNAAIKFPWAQPHVLHVLKNISGYIYCYRNEFQISNESEKSDSRTLCKFQDFDTNTVLGLYFSAHWCPPCKAFTSQLIKTYRTVKESGHKFEIIFVSSDRSAESYAHYISTMPWLAIPYEDNASRTQLTTLFGVQGIPSLILLNPDGSVISDDGRGEIKEDPEGTNFPWYPKPVYILTPRLAAELQNNPAVVLFIDGEEDGEIELATAVVTPISERVKKKFKESLLFFIAIDSDTSESLRDFLRLEDVSPLLTLIDIPLGRLSVMEYGKEITEQTIMNFVNRFYTDELIFLPIDR